METMIIASKLMEDLYDLVVVLSFNYIACV